MSRRSTTLPALFSVLALAVACGGNADSAEQPPGAESPAAEAAPEPSTPPMEPEAAPADAAPAARAARPDRATAPAPQAPAEPEPESTPAPVRAVAPGTTFPLALETALSTEENVAGDAFSARLTVDVLGEDGEVLLPQGTRVNGVVTEASNSPSPDVPAVLRLRIANVVVGSETLPVSAEVEDVQLQAGTRDSNRETAAKVAVGAAAGALLGKVVGGGAKRGAAVGAAAGAVVAITTRDGHAALPEGARLTVRVLEPLLLPAAGR